MTTSDKLSLMRLESLIAELGSLHHLYSISMFIRTEKGLERYTTGHIQQQDILNRTPLYIWLKDKLSIILKNGGIVLSFSGFPSVNRIKTNGYILCKGDWSVCSSEVIELFADMIS